MQDFEKVMLAVYQATVEDSKPFADYQAIFKSVGLSGRPDVGLVLDQRGFLGHCPHGSIVLSQTGIDYVESRLL